jgi:uncharacterized protein (TIGR03435 family)
MRLKGRAMFHNRPRFIILSITAAVLVLQAYPQELDTFEVAAIKPSGPDSIRGTDGGPGTSNPGRFTYGRATLLDLIARAYNVDFFQVISRSPLDRDRFDLAATIPPGTTLPQFRRMLRNLLAERFRFRAHIESQDLPALALVTAKSGHKLQESMAGSAERRVDERFPKVPPGRSDIISRHAAFHLAYELVRINAQQQHLEALIPLIRNRDGKPIVNATALNGTYDFTLEFHRLFPGVRPPETAPAPDLPDLDTALRLQLGLELVERKWPFQIVVVDSFNRTPTEN